MFTMNRDTNTQENKSICKILKIDETSQMSTQISDESNENANNNK